MDEQAGKPLLGPWRCDGCGGIFESLDVPGQASAGWENGKYVEKTFCVECVRKSLPIQGLEGDRNEKP